VLGSGAFVIEGRQWPISDRLGFHYWFSILNTAHLGCLPYLRQLIDIISSLVKAPRLILGESE